MEAFAWFDLILVALVLLLGIKGLINGFIKEIFGIIGLIGGVIVASRYASDVGEFVSKNIFAIQESFWFHLGFLVTLVGFWLICLGLGYLFNKLLNMSGLGFFDKILGFIVGSAKIFLVFAIFVFIISRISFLNEKLEKYTSKSYLYPILLLSGEFIMNQNLPMVKTATKQVEKNSTFEGLNSSFIENNSSITTDNNESNATR